MDAQQPVDAATNHEDPFARVVCGIDASEESLEAARQAARLVSADGKLLLVGVANLAKAGLIYMGAGAMVESLEAETRAALERALADVGGVHTVEAESLIGLPPRDLLSEAERHGASLLVVGTHGRSRPLGAFLGSVATTAVHKTPCSVLVARSVADPMLFPQSIVCGVDGSSQAAKAAAVATGLAARFDASLRFVLANANDDIDLDSARTSVGNAQLETVPDDPFDALVAASENAELLIVGSRDLSGPRAIGSVSERVAHAAACSVLVVH